ncbi:SDR family NAD(P)-dependent oxidoreductase [Leptospira wolffii]|uniref:Short-chain dehydrogenase n=1 Tax=Leptospira wolffii TaxID=409998 RepID=A0A2M9ZGL0_9LEPT|nr:SDR family NAD(P)-dependent oxidoreductase [Leptospira wolffii]PJZ67514.1 short-chain dehydrogenase [Leptospira wolffii]TGK62524.1 SDR family NAD(P)-dependent oxidoreductase [Leptospira wolffii]TGK70408.1 SDR family NAD(P)-dependent oxidoreductase [Leptospira wolffii]TGK74091.1 SDR family NAD(P)-dependent oxidoreductase [Leptospira wolffii]TGL28950.1 SDR family NAD(P)-dependent oxidoreductase [Leptospira wolffii]
MSSRLRGKNILITGASGGFGKELTKQLLEKGANLILTDLKAPDTKPEYYTGSSKPLEGKILGSFGADLSNEAGCGKAYKEAIKIHPQVDILVNNAGLAFMGKLLDIPAPKWKLILDVNLYAPIYLSQLFLPGMLQRKYGQIVNLSSVAGITAPGELVYYSVSKFGIRALGEALDSGYRSQGVYTTNVYPFFADTAILKSEQFGTDKQKVVPPAIVDSPKMVVRAIVRGMEKRKMHVFPGFTSKLLRFLTRLSPGLLRGLERVGQKLS